MISAVIFNSYILQAGYTLDTFVDGHSMRFVNQTGGSIWVYRLDNSLCMPFQGLLRITLLMKTPVMTYNIADKPMPDITFDSDDDSVEKDGVFAIDISLLLSAALAKGASKYNVGSEN